MSLKRMRLLAGAALNLILINIISATASVAIEHARLAEERAHRSMETNDIYDYWDKITVKPSLSEPVSCKDETGATVNWFIAYKLPKINEKLDPLLTQGSRHYVLLPGAATWTKSAFAINDTKSVVGKTLEPLHNFNADQLKNVATVLYNDQPPDLDPTLRDGHTKGIVIGETSGTGLWMMHSVPHFPKPAKPFFYPPGGLENGQMFFCITAGAVELNAVLGNALRFTKATFYNSTVPDSMRSAFNQIYDVAFNNATVKTAPYYNSWNASLGSLQFELFAKGPKFHREIYADWIAPKFNTSLDVQSWLQGAHSFQSNCSSLSQQYVLNVVQKTMNGQNFSSYDDHSKWGVGESKFPVTCVTDLNRAKPQKGRGGLAVCIQDVKVWAAFKSLVDQTQPCSITRSLRRPSSSSNLTRKQRKNRHQVISTVTG